MFVGVLDTSLGDVDESSSFQYNYRSPSAYLLELNLKYLLELNLKKLKC